MADISQEVTIQLGQLLVANMDLQKQLQEKLQEVAGLQAQLAQFQAANNKDVVVEGELVN